MRQLSDDRRSRTVLAARSVSSDVERQAVGAVGAGDAGNQRPLVLVRRRLVLEIERQQLEPAAGGGDGRRGRRHAGVALRQADSTARSSRAAFSLRSA